MPRQKSKEYKVPYAPRKPQLAIHKAPQRFKVIVAHRRFGKTTSAVNEIIKHALEEPGSRLWYIAPTYRQAKNIAFDMFQKYLPRETVARKNERELTFRLFNDSLIELKGAENKDNLRGAGIDGIVFDEFQMIDKYVWEAVIEPMLNENDRDGWAWFLGTPMGKNFFEELYQRGLDEEEPEWKSFHFSAMDTDVFTPEYLEKKKKELTQDDYRQEYLAEFVEGGGMVFRGLDKVLEDPMLLYEDSPVPGKMYQMGVDLARLMDWTVITVVDSNLRVIYHDRFQEKDWNLQKLKIAHISERFFHCKINVDASGMGDPIAQDLGNMGLHVQPIKLSHAMKSQLIENLQLRIEQMQCTIPDDEVIVGELRSFTFRTSSYGNKIYGAPTGYHDDCVISLALAIYDMIPNIGGSSFAHRSHYPVLEDDY